MDCERSVSLFPLKSYCKVQIHQEQRINKEIIVNFHFKGLEYPILSKNANMESTLLKWRLPSQKKNFKQNRTAYQSMMYPVLTKESDLDFLPILIDESCYCKGNNKVPQTVTTFA